MYFVASYTNAVLVAASVAKASYKKRLKTVCYFNMTRNLVI